MAEPFIRQAGGKREMADAILALMPTQHHYDMYVEPFIGGGAVFFALWNAGRLDAKHVFLGDVDADLVNLYEAVKDDVLGLSRKVGQMVAGAIKTGDVRKAYERERRLWNTRRDARTPARHLFLRHFAFNGLWRVNRAGEMNTPWKQEAKLYDSTKLMRACGALRASSHASLQLLDWDFRKYETDDSFYIGARTLVFLDPPYLGDDDSVFTSYAGTWSENDLHDLLRLCAEWSARGAHVVLTHSDVEVFRRALAVDWPDARRHPVLARRSINSDGNGRGPVQELIVVSRDLLDEKRGASQLDRKGV